MPPSSGIRKPLTRTPRPRTRPGPEALEDRLAPAVLLNYGGPGSILGLQELVSGATPGVTISEPAANLLRIDLGSNTFDGSSTAKATGLTYENADSPSTSHRAVVDISQANGITILQAVLPGVSLTLGTITDASGGLGNVTASASVITVTGLDTSNATAGNGNVDLKATQSLTVAPYAAINTGAGTLALGAGPNGDGSLVFSSGSTVTSSNTGEDAITLQGASIQIDTSPDGALIGSDGFLGGPPRATLGGVDQPPSMVVDRQGNLYVVETFQGTVTKFAAGSTVPTATLNGLSTPTTLALDPSGNLFVGDPGADAVYKFAPGATRPTSKLTGLTTPGAVACDAQGNVYVANSGGNTVSVFAPGATTPTSTLTGLSLPSALAFDSRGYLFVGNSGLIGAPVQVFAPGATFPTYQLSGSSVSTPVALAVDASDNVYVASVTGTSVSVFAPNATSPGRTITGLNRPTAIAVDVRGNVYVLEGTGGNSVLAVAPGATTSTTRISGLNDPTALLHDAGRGNLYVADQSDVRIFGLNSTAGGVVIRPASPDQPINAGVSGAPNAGPSLSGAELARIVTTSAGTLTFGGPDQTGNITLRGVSPSSPGASVRAIQSPTGPGAILLLVPATDEPALSTGAGSIRLAAGAGGILNSSGPFASMLGSTGQVTLDATGGIGTSSTPLTFDAAATPSSLTVGATTPPAGAVFLSALGTLALANVQTADAPLVVVANGDLTVVPGAVVDTGAGTLSLTAGVDPGGFGTGAGTLTIGAGAAVVSRNTGRDAISLRAYVLDIAAGSVPATVGLARGVGVPPVPVAGGVILRNSDRTQPILVGMDSGPGLVLGKAVLAQIFTTAGGTLTFGDSTQTGNITFASVAPATTQGAGVAAIQSPGGGGAILLDSTAGTALTAGSGAIALSAGTGGIVAVGGGTGLATTGPVALDTAGGIGSSTGRLLFDGATPSLVTVGSSTEPASGVFLSAPGNLTLGHVATTNAVLDVTATGNLTVATGAVVDTGTAPLFLAAGVNPDGSPSNGGGTLALSGGAQVVSANPGANAISLRGSDLAIDTIDAPVFIGATPGAGGNPPTPVAGGVLVRTARPDQPISLGATNAGTGVVLSGDELARIFTRAGGTLTFGDPGQTGDITFDAVTLPKGAGIVALQSPTGPGAIVLDSTAGTALDAGERPIRLAAGAAGIVARGGGTSLSTTVQITLDTAGGIGSNTGRVVLDGAATFALLTVGSTTVPGGGVYLGGLGGVTLGNVRIADAPLDVTGAMFVAVSPSAAIDTGTGTLSLAAGVNPDGSPSNGGPGVLGIENGATVVSRNAGRDAITLRGADLELATGPNGAYIGARPSPFGTIPTATLTGLGGPQGMALDAQGNLYVANVTADTVSVFAPGSTTPFRTLTGLNNPALLAFDAGGNLYVTNNGGNTVSAFAPGATTPTWTLTGLSTPYPIAVDAQGFLYVGNFDTGTVSLFTPRSTTPFKTLTGLSVPTALAFDQFGNLYVANAGADTVSVFGPGGGALIKTLTGLDHPLGMAFDALGNLYVLNTGLSGSVSIFAPGSITPTTTITGLDAPGALALDAQGNLYVANGSGSGPIANTVSVFAPGSTTPTASLTGLNIPKALLFDALGRLLASNSGSDTVTAYSAPTPVPLAGGVTIRTNQPAEPINIGASSGKGLTLSDAELAQLFVVAGGGVTVGDSSLTGDITVTGSVHRHPGYDTLILQTQQGTINSAGGATLAVANLAMQAGSGIGTTAPIAIDATHLAFASRGGPIRVGDANAVTLTSVGTLSASSIPGDVFSATNVGDTYILLHSGGGVSGQITYNGRALAEGAMLTLADGNHYRISYRGNGGQDVTLTRIAGLTLPPPQPPSPGPVPPSPGPVPPPPAGGVSLIGETLVITGSPGDDVVRLMSQGKTLRVYASFLPAGVKFLAFKQATVKDVLIQLGDGDDRASVGPQLRSSIVIEGGAGDDELLAGGGSLLIGGPGRDILATPPTGRRGSILIGRSTAFDANDRALSAILAEWSSSRPLRARIANLAGDGSSRQRRNGNAFLNARTLIDDLARDVLLGHSRRDWFLPGPGDVVFDRNPRASSQRGI